MAGNKVSGKKSHDWIALEHEFMAGSWMNLTDFLVDKGIAESGNTRKHTFGWVEKKESKRREIYQQVTAETQDKLKANLQKGYHNLLNIGILGKLVDPKKLEKMSPGDIEKLWKILRTEHGLPTQIKHLGEDQNSKFTNWIDNVKGKIIEE